MTIDDFASGRRFVYDFEILADKRTILEINGSDGTAHIHYESFEPIDPERVGRLDTLLHKSSLEQGEIDELLTAIGEGILIEKDPPSTGVQGREVSIRTKSLSDRFDRCECEYFAWDSDPQLNPPDRILPKSISFETILARKMEKHGYRFAKVSDPYQVDWGRTLFFQAGEVISAEGTEVTIALKILKITLTTQKESGQPCLVEEGVWMGDFTLGLSLYQKHREDIAERMSKLIDQKDANRVEEW